MYLVPSIGSRLRSIRVDTYKIRIRLKRISLPDLVRTFALQRSKHGIDYKVALMVAGVLVLMFPEGWPRAWHGSGALPVAVFHANS